MQRVTVILNNPFSLREENVVLFHDNGGKLQRDELDSLGQLMGVPFSATLCSGYTVIAVNPDDLLAEAKNNGFKELEGIIGKILFVTLDPVMVSDITGKSVVSMFRDAR